MWPSGVCPSGTDEVRHPEREGYSLRCELPSGIVDGPFRAFGYNGRIRERGDYHAGKREGVWRVWNADEQLLSEASWRAGVSDGVSRSFYLDGKPSEVTTYKDGKKSGEWTVFLPTGRPAVQGTFRDGVPDGLWRWFDSDGNVQRVVTYHNGEEVKE